MTPTVLKNISMKEENLLLETTPESNLYSTVKAGVCSVLEDAGGSAELMPERSV